MSDLIPITVEHRGSAWPLWTNATGGAPLVLDLDLAKWAEQRNPSNVLRMIEHYEADLRDLGDLYRLEIAPPRGGGKARMATYLNEAQALFLIAKMETQKAKAALKTVIAVFLHARDMLSGLPQLRAELVAVNARVSDLQRLVGSGVIGESAAKTYIRGPIKRIALYETLERRTGLAHWRKKTEEKVRRAAKHHRDWRLLPREKLGEAQGVIDDLLREAKAGAAQRNADRQQDLRGIAAGAGR